MWHDIFKLKSYEISISISFLLKLWIAKENNHIQIKDEIKHYNRF